MDKKNLVMLLLILSLPLASAELKIQKSAVIDSVVPELNQPAVFDLKIKNLGSSDLFRIYSLVGVNIKPNESFSIDSGQEKEIRIELWPEKKILETPGTFNFIYRIQGQNSGIQEDVIAMRVVNLKNALEINSYNIHLESEKAIVYVKNMIGLEFPDIKADFHSAFFDFSRKFSLEKYEKKDFEISLNREEIKRLIAGSYTTTTDVEISSIKEKIENTFKFTEKADISTKEIRQGFIINRKITEKTNNGNLPFVVQVKAEKNIISRLFTTFNIEPSVVERKGFSVAYTFQEEIKPSEIFTVKVTTNWLYPLILLIAVLIIVFLVKIYTSSYVSLTKKASFIRAKGGEFALKITLIIRTQKFIEKINVIDRLPSLVKVYERFGAVTPDRIDEKNKRIEWNIDSLQPGEERVFSYVIYSKIAPVGKFEIPQATAVYEREGKTHEASSNKVFFLNTPRRFED